MVRDCNCNVYKLEKYLCTDMGKKDAIPSSGQNFLLGTYTFFFFSNIFRISLLPSGKKIHLQKDNFLALFT